MSEKEVRRAGVLARVKEGELKLVSAAEIVELSYRQTKRLWQRYRREGAQGLVHGNAGRRSNQAKAKEFRQRVLRLVREQYSGDVAQRLGPTLAAEHVEEDHGVKVHRETLRLWMLEEGLWSRQRKRKPYRRRRERKAHFGELVQMDGRFHDWLEDRGSRLCLMNMVDDATGVTLARFHEQETIWGAVDVLRAWVKQYGVPRALYTDWKNVYVREPSAEERDSGQAPLTQFGRMCATLGTRIIPASSPQAKGRVERNHGTHQDRLVKKLRLQGISTKNDANAFLRQRYLPGHNRRFTQTPADADDFHRTAPDRFELERVFCLEQERVIGNDWVIHYEGRVLQLERWSRYAPAGQRVIVRETAQGRLSVHYRGQRVSWREIVAPPKPPTVPAPAVRAEIRTTRPAPAKHPWHRAWSARERALQLASGSPNPGLPSASHSGP